MLPNKIEGLLSLNAPITTPLKIAGCSWNVGCSKPGMSASGWLDLMSRSLTWEFDISSLVQPVAVQNS